MFANLFRRANGTSEVADNLYRAIVRQARNPVFYLDYGVPDTETGRFEMICLFIFPVLRRLKDLGPDGAALSQATHDAMFADLDRTLREMGFGDMGVGKRVKKLATGLYGRIGAYEAGLEAAPPVKGMQGDPLIEALRRNLYGTVLDDNGGKLADGSSPSADQISAMAAYLRRAATGIETANAEELLGGNLEFPLPQPGPQSGPQLEENGK